MRLISGSLLSVLGSVLGPQTCGRSGQGPASIWASQLLPTCGGPALAGGGRGGGLQTEPPARPGALGEQLPAPLAATPHPPVAFNVLLT